jgi:hypothetical protein
MVDAIEKKLINWRNIISIVDVEFWDFSILVIIAIALMKDQSKWFTSDKFFIILFFIYFFKFNTYLYYISILLFYIFINNIKFIYLVII